MNGGDTSVWGRRSKAAVALEMVKAKPVACALPAATTCRFALLTVVGLILLGLVDGAAIARGGLWDTLVGHWEGEGLEIRIDEDAIQANDDPTKPFQWDAFHVINVTGRFVIFDIGKRRYVAMLGGDRLTVTVVGYSGAHVLTKKSDWPRVAAATAQRQAQKPKPTP